MLLVTKMREKMKKYSKSYNQECSKKDTIGAMSGFELNHHYFVYLE